MMRLDPRLEKARIQEGPLASSVLDGVQGAFVFLGPYNRPLLVVSSNELGWEHVSVSTRKTTPAWREMCLVKDLFWDPEDTVIQYHPPRSVYVNNCGNCLHLWRPVLVNIPLPDPILVGVADSILAKIAEPEPGGGE